MTQPQKTLIEGKVAKILNDRELAINVGSDKGVQTGYKFQIVQETDEILDPDTKKNLGRFRRVVIRVKIVAVDPLKSIAQTYETYIAEPTIIPSINLALRGTLLSDRTVVKTLRRPGSSVTEDYLVKIGDIAVLIEDD